MIEYTHGFYSPVFAEGVVEGAKKVLLNKDITITAAIDFISSNYDLNVGLPDEFSFLAHNRICDLLEVIFEDKFSFHDCGKVRLLLNRQVPEEWVNKKLSHLRD